METNWRTIEKELVELLAAPDARRCFASLRADVAALRPWSGPRFVASFLSRRTPPLEHRKAVLRALLSVVAEGGGRAEVAGTILLLAGTLAVPRLRRHKRGGPAPVMPFVLVVGYQPVGIPRQRDRRSPPASNAPDAPSGVPSVTTTRRAS